MPFSQSDQPIKPLPFSNSGDDPFVTPEQVVKNTNQALVQSILAALQCSRPDKMVGYLNSDGAVYRCRNTVVFSSPADNETLSFSNEIFRLSSRAFYTSMKGLVYKLVNDNNVEAYPLSVSITVVKERSLSPIFPSQYEFLIIRLNDLVFCNSESANVIPCLSPLRAQLKMLPSLLDSACQFSVGYPRLLDEIEQLESVCSISSKQVQTWVTFIATFNEISKGVELSV